MNSFKIFTGWGWAEVIFFMLVIAVDNSSVNHDGLWVTLLIVSFSAIEALSEEAKYNYSMPVNHPEQVITEQGILGNFVRSWLGLFMCWAPILYGPTWVKVVGVLVVLIAAYAVVASHRLFFFTKGDVKYDG